MYVATDFYCLLLFITLILVFGSFSPQITKHNCARDKVLQKNMYVDNIKVGQLIVKLTNENITI